MAHNDPQKQPAIITGKVTVSNAANAAAVPAGTIVQVRSPGYQPLQANTNDNGIYSIDVGVEGIVLELYVNGKSTGEMSARTKFGEPQAIHLVLPR